MSPSEFAPPALAHAITLGSEHAPRVRKGIVRHGTGPLRPIPTKPLPFSKRLLNAGARLNGKARAHIGGDPDILVVEDVARVLRCTVDTARRIPRDLLPAYPGPGRHRLYLREELVSYLRSSVRSSPKADLLVQRIRDEVVGSRLGNGRERSAQRRTQ